MSDPRRPLGITAVVPAVYRRVQPTLRASVRTAMATNPACLAVLLLLACAPGESSEGSSEAPVGAGSSTVASVGSGGDDRPETGGSGGDGTTQSPPHASSEDTAPTGADTGTDATDDHTATEGSAGSSTGVAPVGPQWAVTSLSYTNGVASETVEHDDCTFCDATLAGGQLLLRFQQADGWTVWSVYIPEASVVGTQPVTADFSGAYMNLSENNGDLPADFIGYYDPTTAAGTLALTQADIQPGGAVAGTLSATLSLGDVDAQLDAEFYAEIPAG